MNIVILDGYTTNPGDLSWEPVQKYGQVSIFARTSLQELEDRAQNAEILLTNKYPLGQEDFKILPFLKCICVLATGYNNIDIQAAKDHNIKVYNATGYSTNSVAQHTFSLLLTIINQSQKHHDAVVDLVWSNGPDFSFSLLPIRELAGKTLGIFGFGNIGQQVGAIGKAFGMKVLAVNRGVHKDIPKWAEAVDRETLFKESDIISLHAPLNSQTRSLINKDTLELMQPHAILINTARGGLVKEEDLVVALKNRTINAAGLDVLVGEPPSKNNPLIGLPNCWITPHQAWASLEARKKLIEITAANIGRYLASDDENRVA